MSAFLALTAVTAHIIEWFDRWIETGDTAAEQRVLD